MDRFFDQFFAPSGFISTFPGNFAPEVDLKETDKGYELQASVAGFKPEEITIDINQDLVTIRGEKKEEHEEKKENYLYQERRVGSFYRQVRLPVPVESGKSEAVLKDGVLTVTLPKTAPTTVKHLPVKSA
jgi:HSP20 family protein